MAQGHLKGKRLFLLTVMSVMAAVLLGFTGCTMLSEEQVKLQDLGFTVVSEEKLP